MTNDLVKVLDLLDVRNFTIVGNKVMLKYLKISNEDSVELFSNINFEFHVDELVASYIPKCIKTCNSLDLRVGEFDGYLPKVKHIFRVSPNLSKYDRVVDIKDMVTEEVILGNSTFKGLIKANNVILGGMYQQYTTVDNLTVIGLGDSSSIDLDIRKYEGLLRIKEFNKVYLGGVRYFDKGSIHFTDCSLLDLSNFYTDFYSDRLTLSNVDILKINRPFEYECLLESNKLIITYNDIGNLRDKKFCDMYKSRFLCNECVIGRVSYNKNNCREGTFPNVIFK